MSIVEAGVMVTQIVLQGDFGTIALGVNGSKPEASDRQQHVGMRNSETEVWQGGEDRNQYDQVNVSR
jgi:hypothetical protein